MYGLATQQVDMNAHVSHLVEQGVVEKTYDSRYHEWQKQWSEMPEQAIVPTVSPIRLSKKCSNDTPTDMYEYSPLDMVADEIRVLVLTPSVDTSASVVCHVGHCPIHCEVTYMALSYSWGQDATPAEIVLNGQIKRIRKSLEDVLRALRRPDKVLSLWVDAISINQEDVIERNRYVGHATHDTEPAIELVKELKMPMMRFNNHGEWHFGDWNGEGWYGENRIGPERLAAILELRFEQLDQAAYHLQDMLRTDPRLAGQMMSADNTLEVVDPRELAYVRKLFYFRHLASKGLHPSWGTGWGAKIGESAPAYLETVIMAREFQSTDPRDKIYALWNLAQDKVGLEFAMDYSVSVRDVYVHFAIAWATQHRELDILAAAEQSEESRDFYRTAPSWCPDWDTPSASSCLVRRERIPAIMMMVVDDLGGKLYAADGAMKRDMLDLPLFHFDGTIVNCTGIILHRIDFFFEEPPDCPKETTFPSCDPDSFWSYQHWSLMIEQYYSGHDLTTYDNPARAATATFHGDVEAAWPPREENLDNSSDRHPLEKYVCMPAMSRHVRPYGGSYNRTDARDVTSVVLDALSHPIEDILTGASCENSTGGFDSAICPTAAACAQSCALEGINYAQHGVQAHGDSIALRQYLEINGTETSVSPRLYLLAPNGKDYTLLRLLNQEISFTVDVSNLPCGTNGALYMSAMDASGGRSRLNPAGATYGTGYCDAQCGAPAWINGVANIDDLGACCSEMDIWEANAVATQLTPHACNVTGLYECSGAACGTDGVCDKSGCGSNPYGLGAHSFYGYHDIVDTSKPFTVVTQFLTDDNTTLGTLNQIRRLYVQNGTVTQNANVQSGDSTVDSITNAYCEASAPSFEARGGLAQMGEALGRGMVLIFSIWNDAGAYMDWLDSGTAGPCNSTEGNPVLIEAEDPGTSVTFSNIKWGDIGSTYGSSARPSYYHS
ncbi:hypothetical protein LTR85_007973 [Meristemomyces frigidus]|nr:hypothetical protein LTR85_007973 [Meristemomyces frigidus]